MQTTQETKVLPLIFAVTESDYHELCEQNMGFCPHCQQFTHDSCEPDVDDYECPECHIHRVHGVEQAMMVGLITVACDE